MKNGDIGINVRHYAIWRFAMQLASHPYLYILCVCCYVMIDARGKRVSYTSYFLQLLQLYVRPFSDYHPYKGMRLDRWCRWCSASVQI